MTHELDPDKVREELREHGAWDDEQLADDSENWRRLVWIAAWNVADSDEEPGCSEPAEDKASMAC